MASVTESATAPARNQRFRRRSCLAQLTYTWASPLLYRGFKNELTPEELWDLDDGMKAKSLFNRLKPTWDQELKLPKGERSLQRAVFKTFKWQIVKVVASMFLYYFVNIITAGIIFPGLIRVLADYSTPTVALLGQSVPLYGIYYAAAFFVLECVRSVSTNNMWFQGMVLGQSMQVSVREMAYDKLTKLKYGQVAYGRVLNIVSTDTFRLQMAGVYGHFVFHCAPYLIMLAIVCSLTFGPAVLVGLATMIAFIPIQACVGKKLGKLRASTSKITDHRVSLMSEILKAVKLIKLYAWEARFSTAVADIREKECDRMKDAAVIVACNNVIGSTSIIFVMAVTFLVHVAFGGRLEAASTFSLLALFNTARFPLTVLSVGTRALAEARIGLQRTTDLLSEEELPEDESRPAATAGEDAIKVKGTFEWSLVSANAATAVGTNAKGKAAASRETKEEPKQVDSNDSGRLENIDLTVKAGALVGIVGPVGSGKSSLLVGSMLGHMEQVSGQGVEMKGSVAICMQESWIFNGTVQENILFGLKMDKGRYLQVLAACCLDTDLDALPAGDLTEIGERGVNLSGGQKARISLARAVYSDSDIVLLDDPLSAVDVHVGKHLMEQAICGPLMDGKTRVLVTHQTQFLHECDSIAVLEKGKIVKEGTYDEVHSLFDSLMDNGETSENEEEERRNSDLRALSSTSSISESQLRARSISGELTTAGINLSVDEGDSKSALSAKLEKGKLIEEEKRKSGSVSIDTVKNWIRAAGGRPVFICYILLSFSYQFATVATDWFLAKWTERAFAGLTQAKYAGIYFGLGCAVSLIFMASSAFYHLHALVASRGLHDRVFRRVLQGAMSFFDVTPMGRILSNFSSDLDVIDTLLPGTTEQCYTLLCRCVASVILISIITTWFLIPLIPLVVVYAYLALHFRHVVRQLKRMDNMSKGPLFGHIGSTARGLCTIRAFKYMGRFLQQERAYSDNASRANWAFGMANRWIGFRLDLITTCIVTVTALICTCMRSSISPSLSALCIVYALQMGGVFQYGTRLIAESEALMTSVERLTAFEENVKVEANEKGKNTSKDVPSKSWPAQGEILFKNVRARYRAGLPEVLKGVSFALPGGKKLGICGRTGSGKSSLTLCLWRMLDEIRGSIKIDGVETSAVELHQLRSKLSIIPQDPILFIGTLRSNLDPFEEKTDAEIWGVLAKVHLAEFIKELPKQLETLVEEGGGNFSQGQCQLVCFARALLRGTKIIALDEATASVDMATDALIGETIREAFQNCTMIIIAHRLHTVVGCDLILVLNEGTVDQFGSPQELIKKDGSFLDLVNETGEKTSEYLKGLIGNGTRAEGK
jgi:ABC-type multidrug transport system fused ATPase/permease subunit